MRDNIIEILTDLSEGKKPFYEQDILPEGFQNRCATMLETTSDIKELNDFFDREIDPIIFHSHNMHLAHR